MSIESEISEAAENGYTVTLTTRAGREHSGIPSFVATTKQERGLGIPQVVEQFVTVESDEARVTIRLDEVASVALSYEPVAPPAVEADPDWLSALHRFQQERSVPRRGIWPFRRAG